MKGILIRWLVLTAAIIVASYVLDGIQVKGFFSAFFAAAILGVLNAFFRPILIILTLPINILTLGLFTFIINALLLKMASGVISGFDVRGFWAAVFGSIIISVVSWALNSFISPKGRVEYIDLKKKGDRWE
ncbi:MAG: phage holin family protein [Deltaproteobacteria bacterium]|nr:MAG: phage holin family protein [Deltaproteobacteria bacterium]UCH06265.1 MAG: phage holin family protein [Deltaproteobacteria bacterium]